MTSHERPLVIHGPHARDMLGIVSLPAPDTPQQTTGVVIVVGGAQYRVGSHRQFVQLARGLAAAGYPVLRFDFPGMGDSPGSRVPFEDSAPHIAAAIDALHGRHGKVDKVVLWGLCDGASASLLYMQATGDSRVAGLALLNPWVRSDAGLARARVKHYYRQRLLEPAFWRKLAAGGVGWQALRGLGSNLRTMRQKTPEILTFQELMAQGWHAFEGKMILILSGRDLTAQEFVEHAKMHPAWRGLLARPGVSEYQIHGADHTFSGTLAKREVETVMLAWLKSLHC
ncbi:hydrolase 1, exosortase A system-associated [Acidovorax sp. SRB_14]|uniref:hydrolase 1, exosortase A system-associated n=1 Tax=Acidovorax sp. SRB_14 TaxID=1962699 RepID=UPI0015673764|nr:hydrolase 1, exosortase A system-associated [Acidovorax sp. SRB_14]NMM81183.1 hydrolase 1, exosortase A system-associated [Acidovorax sp. SRB_14]